MYNNIYQCKEKYNIIVKILIHMNVLRTSMSKDANKWSVWITLEVSIETLERSKDK